ncbi:MAG: hypothetical protein Q7S43_05205 [bacterium]|nr:hypothetical protein [bacterium]
MALRREVERLQETADEMRRYRGFWGEEWPKGIRVVKVVGWVAVVLGGAFTLGAAGFGAFRLWQIRQEAERARRSVDVALINDLAKEYSSDDMLKALEAVHATRTKPPETVDGTDIDGFRRYVTHFWIRIAIMVAEGIREDLLRSYFLEGVDDWPPLASLERLKLTEMYTRQGQDQEEVVARVNKEMSEHPVERLYKLWR